MNAIVKTHKNINKEINEPLHHWMNQEITQFWTSFCISVSGHIHVFNCFVLYFTNYFMEEKVILIYSMNLRAADLNSCLEKCIVGSLTCWWGTMGIVASIRGAAIGMGRFGLHENIKESRWCSNHEMKAGKLHFIHAKVKGSFKRLCLLVFRNNHINFLGSHVRFYVSLFEYVS